MARYASLALERESVLRSGWLGERRDPKIDRQQEIVIVWDQLPASG